MGHRIANALVVVAAVMVSFAGVRVFVNASQAAATGPWQGSADVSLVPARSDISLSAVDGSRFSTSAASAVSAAEAAWGFRDDQVAAVVSADVSKAYDPLHQNQRGWVVVANQDMPDLGDPSRVFHKLVTVVDGTHGRYLWAYAADQGPAG
jgi:hypothetical protein